MLPESIRATLTEGRFLVEMNSSYVDNECSCCGLFVLVVGASHSVTRSVKPVGLATVNLQGRYIMLLPAWGLLQRS